MKTYTVTADVKCGPFAANHQSHGSSIYATFYGKEKIDIAWIGRNTSVSPNGAYVSDPREIADRIVNLLNGVRDR